MAEVTDAVFRRLVADCGRPDLLWTEFVSADGLLSSGRERLLRDLAYTEFERPIIAQLFTANPENLRQAAGLIVQLGFDGLDINMGCPDRSVERQGAGAALIKNPELAQTLIRAAQDGVAAAGRTIPISVKTRLGYYRTEEFEPWFKNLLEAEPAAITIHARTRQELSLVPARWEALTEAIRWRNEQGSKTLIIGNGDVENLATGRRLADEVGVDGVMIGRGIFGRPWLFADRGDPPWSKRLNILIKHLQLFQELLADIKPYAVMKKHFKAYIFGFAEAAKWRAKLMETEKPIEAIAILDKLKSVVIDY